MNRQRRNSRTKLYSLLAFTGLVILFLWPTFTAAMPLTAKHQLLRAWRLANDIGVYDYHTDVLQTTHRTERLVNVGRHAEHKRMSVEGKLNRHENEMYMQLRGLRAGTTLEIKSKDGVAVGRTRDTDDWIEMDGQTELFAPGGDPMGFLVAAENIELLTTSQYEIDKKSPRYQKPTAIYSFDLSGQKYARYMKEKMKEQLQREGELPAGVDLELAEEYLKMKGHGEIWLNGDGCPCAR